MCKTLKSKIGTLLHKGFFHIAGANIVNKIIVALTNILITRFLGKYSYGVFSSAYNIYSIFIIFSGLGMYSAILIYCSEERSKSEKKAYYRYGLVAGFLASILLSIGMFLYGTYAPLGIPETKKYILLLSVLPLLDYIVQYFLVILRTQKLNKTYAFYTNISTITYFLLGCLGAKFAGITGTIIGRYASYILVTLLSIKSLYPYLAHGTVGFLKGLKKSEKKDLWSYSIKNGASSAFNQILYLIDVALLTCLVRNAEVVASYKVAVLIPEGLAFIPQSIMVFLVPIFSEHNKDKKWLKPHIKQLFFYSGLLNAVISALLIILAPFIISILWGDAYLDSVPCFRILSVNYFFMATFRMSCTNILAVLRKVNFNLVLGIVAGVMDIILDFILIQNFSAIGAAVATLVTVLFISGISMPYLIHEINKSE